MKLADHQATPRGRLFLYGGIALGMLFMLALITHGFGLFRAHDAAESSAQAFTRKGDTLVVPDGSPLRSRLSVAAAKASTVAQQLVLPAVVESDPSRTAAVLSPLAGRLVELRVALGDRVSKGQVLAIIDSPDLEQAYEDFDKAADALQLASRNLERQQGQFEIGTASSRDLDQAKSDHTQAAAEFARTQGRLRALGVAADATQRPKMLPVRAPVAGSITTLSIARGNMLNDATQPLMTVSDLSTVWVTALVAEKDVGSVSRGQSAEVVVDAYPGKVLRGKVLFVSDVLEADSRRNKLRIAFSNSDSQLKPNMFATVTLAGAERSRVTVPTSALLMNNDRTSVFVATAPWTFQRRFVHLELDEGTTVALDAGVQAGELIVVKGGILLND